MTEYPKFKNDRGLPEVLIEKAGYSHETVNHGAGEYVRGSCHVNAVEGFWARLKLSIRGTHVSRFGEASSEVCEGV